MKYREPNRNPFGDVAERNSLPIKLEPSQCLEPYQELRAALDTQLKRRGIASAVKLVGNYRPNWVEQALGTKDKNYYFDHGFASAVVALTSAAEYEACGKAIVDEVGPGLRSIEAALGIADPGDRMLFVFSNRLLSSLVAEMIVLHNLYPTHLPAGVADKITTHLSFHPVSYVAFLADSLQRWDRHYLANQATTKLGAFVPGRRYNLEVRDDLLHLRLSDPDVDLSKEQAARDALNTYLKDADALVRLHVEER